MPKHCCNLRRASRRASNEMEPAMKYRIFGRSGLRVSDFALGTMTFGEEWGWGADRNECQRMLSAFADAGGNFIDTASSYTNGASESFLGEFLGERRESFVLATKYTHLLRAGDVNSAGNHRKALRQSLEQSLRRLQTDHIDLLWVHCWDKITPLDEILRALDQAIFRGEVLYIGFSDAPSWVVSRADALADVRGWESFCGIQFEYSLIERSAERDLIPMAEHLGLGSTAWGPLEAGLLSGKYSLRRGGEGPRRIDQAPGFYRGLLTERNESIADEVAQIARLLGATPAQVALAWIRHVQPKVIPILGARSCNQLRENLEAADLRLDDRSLDRLHQVSRIDLGFPHDFLNSPIVRQLSYGAELQPEDFKPSRRAH